MIELSTRTCDWPHASQRITKLQNKALASIYFGEVCENMCSSLLRFSPPAYTVTLTQICVLMTNSHLLVGHTEMYGAIWWVYIIYIHIYAYCIDIYIHTCMHVIVCIYGGKVMQSGRWQA